MLSYKCCVAESKDHKVEGHYRAEGWEHCLVRPGMNVPQSSSSCFLSSTQIPKIHSFVPTPCATLVGLIAKYEAPNTAMAVRSIQGNHSE